MSSKLASLHAGLVARKGEAVPAISHPSFSYTDTAWPTEQQAWWDDEDDRPSVIDASVARLHPAATRPVERPAPVRDDPPVRPVPRAVPAATEDKPVEAHAAGDTLGPYRLTFRMTHDQRRRLRIAAAKKDMSLQAVLAEALDAHLDSLCACSLRDCTCMAREEADD